MVLSSESEPFSGLRFASMGARPPGKPMPMLVNILLAMGKRCVRERAEHPCAEAVCLGGALAARLATLPDTPHRSLLMSMSWPRRAASSMAGSWLRRYSSRPRPCPGSPSTTCHPARRVVTERGFPVAVASSATATFFVASGIAGDCGRLVERIDARAVIAASASIGALTLATAGQLSELWQLYLSTWCLGFLQRCLRARAVTTVVARWFNVRRALAFSIASTGLSFGGIWWRRWWRWQSSGWASRSGALARARNVGVSCR